MKTTKFDSQKSLKSQILATPASMSSLGLGGCLSLRTTDDIVEGLLVTPGWITHIDLSQNELGSRTVDDLIRILKSITASSVFSIDLSINELHRKTAAEIALIIAAFNPYVRSVTLSQNQLGNITPPVSFKTLQPSVTSLNISGNILDQRMGKDLLEIARSFPPTLNDLDFSHNVIFSSVTHLSFFISALSPTIHTLRWYDLLEEEDRRMLAQKLYTLGSTRTSIETLDFGNPRLENQTAFELERLAYVLCTISKNKNIIIEGLLEPRIMEKQKSIQQAIQAGFFAVRDSGGIPLDNDTMGMVFSYMPTL